MLDARKLRRSRVLLLGVVTRELSRMRGPVESRTGGGNVSDSVPVGLKRTDRGLVIEWSDGVVQQLDGEFLLSQCPCATCRERAKGLEAERGQAGPLSLPILGSSMSELVSIAKMEPVGNYAYSIQFSRGCSKGIYTLEYLRSLGGD